MKIATIKLYQVELPYSGGVYLLSGGREDRGFQASIVRIETDTGLESWGESTPFGSTWIASHARGARAGIEEIAPHLLGRDPRQADRINDAMDEALVGHHHAKTALDIACWDVFGKSVDMPVCELLGGATGHRMPTISSIYAGSPEEMRARVASHRQRGYLGHSIKIGALDSEGGPALDAERIAACLADRRPGEFFLVDANGGMLPETALRMLRMLPSGLDFVLEAPCATWRETASLRKRCPVPIILDELAELDGDIARIVAEDAADGIGLTRGRRHRDICRAAGLTISVQDTVESALQGYLVDKASHDAGITSLDDLKDPANAARFDPDGDGKADLAGCVPGWGCERVIEHHLTEYGLRDSVTHNQGEYNAIIADTIARHQNGQPVLYYTWTPYWVSGALVPGEDVEWLSVPYTSLPDGATGETEFGGRNLGFAVDSIRIVARNDFLAANPAARRLFEVAQIDINDISAENKLIADGEDRSADIDRHVEDWIAAHRTEYDAWLAEARKAAE